MGFFSKGMLRNVDNALSYKLREDGNATEFEGEKCVNYVTYLQSYAKRFVQMMRIFAW